MDEELQEVYDTLMKVMKKDNESGNSFYDYDYDALWFTTKIDPTPEDAPSYYELDEYGDPVDKEAIAEEVLAYIGDGATTLREAIGCWMDEALHNNKIYWKNCLRTQFKEKPVVKEIEAYETKLQESIEQYNKLEEGAMTWKQTIAYGTNNPGDFFERLSNILSPNQLNIIISTALSNACSEKDVAAIQAQFNDVEPDKVVTKDDDTVVDEKKLERIDKVQDDLFGYISKYAHLDKNKVEKEGYDYLKKNISNENIPEYVAGVYNKCFPNVFLKKSDVTEKNIANLCREVIEKLVDDEFEEKEKKNKNESKELIENMLKLENKEVKTESAKTKLKEENSKSLNLISQMFQDKDFDSDSKSGQIVMRTSELFNVLSDKGYDVQVAFDNGESTNTILLGQTGGQLIITITDSTTPLKAYTNGNYEMTEDITNTISDIVEQISKV